MARYQGRVSGPESLGRFLQQARVLSGLTQRDMAELLGTSQRYVWEMEAGKPSIFTERLFAMMRASGMSLSASIEPVSHDQAETDDGGGDRG
ncbi:helix-turn-helix domain-containing protein [Propionibacteriaceae bacterium Y2011]|uniref:helix-turn-helix domain-containing protein n=1 Tax=Microlunatus sp. Y2014 TaxID=3418488 RepID=UPI003B4FF955